MSAFDYPRLVPMLIVMFAVLAVIMVAGLQSVLSIDHQTEKAQKEEYRLAVLLENIQSLDASYIELSNTPGTSGYNYDRRRSLIPVEYFWNSASGDEVGFNVRNGHCYFDELSQLDGEEFGFYVQPLENESENTGGSFKAIKDVCKSAEDVGKSYYSPSLLVREDRGNPPLLVRLYVYRIEG